MILQELKRHIEQQGCVSQKELAKKFSMSEDGVDAMLAVWIKKGKISRLVDTNKARKVTRVRYSANGADELSLTVTM
ncbi:MULTISPECIES: FeoC-like transcriptional regulator [Vibrio]|jgi:putative ferrous iron transport protein C|uniref:FeoC-like transcriptional regulator n=1 Tax=Vibrio TaxID=662 RepID=UPI0002D6DAF6|nr:MULTISPECIES: FeoC-like transcriptional regulator [Vibrio]AIU67493.1 iron transporter FeoC [Vibrio coralliilyticus]ANW23566.1 iron transporter FeoC [Vibrio coralliilyticus]AXN29796.1 iron transporter FeoC [Vibrio coralliilyticus]KPH25701.1 iron transporter FeoC [Vibrio coralliilyticus]NOH52805.1 iron transporter FeoC [Vibrio coralliilyticus]